MLSSRRTGFRCCFMCKQRLKQILSKDSPFQAGCPHKLYNCVSCQNHWRFRASKLLVLYNLQNLRNWNSDLCYLQYTPDHTKTLISNRYTRADGLIRAFDSKWWTTIYFARSAKRYWTKKSKLLLLSNCRPGHPKIFTYGNRNLYSKHLKFYDICNRMIFGLLASRDVRDKFSGWECAEAAGYYVGSINSM